MKDAGPRPGHDIPRRSGFLLGQFHLVPRDGQPPDPVGVARREFHHGPRAKGIRPVPRNWRRMRAYRWRFRPLNHRDHVGRAATAYGLRDAIGPDHRAVEEATGVKHPCRGFPTELVDDEPRGLGAEVTGQALSRKRPTSRSRNNSARAGGRLGRAEGRKCASRCSKRQAGGDRAREEREKADSARGGEGRGQVGDEIRAVPRPAATISSAGERRARC